MNSKSDKGQLARFRRKEYKALCRCCRIRKGKHCDRRRKHHSKMSYIWLKKQCRLYKKLPPDFYWTEEQEPEDYEP